MGKQFPFPCFLALESFFPPSQCNQTVLPNSPIIVAVSVFLSFPHTVWKGKCSHGGAVDQTSNINPKGGINKDTFDASHGFLHQQAADVAIAATIQLLEEIRSAAGDRPFLEYATQSACCIYVPGRRKCSHVFALCGSVHLLGCQESPNDPAKLFASWSTPHKAWVTT